MSSPSMVQKSGDTLIIRSVVSGDRLFSESSENVSQTELVASSERTKSESPIVDDSADEGNNLPQCKIKRNYDCVDCNFFTQNPRHYLTHLRDVHGEKVKIYSCPNCLYASKHYQKLLRHMKMVHGLTNPSESIAHPKRRVKEDTQSLDAIRSEEEETRNQRGIEMKTEDKIQKKSSKSELKCSICDFTTNSYATLTKHERKEHLKAKYFPCSKCNYATHIKARFTKHVKYHSMPMIKCEVCDFRTPYKWNLDRHMKNHGGAGLFCCSACNFTADIKQSLTVHEMNHHIPAVGTALTLSGRAGLKRRSRDDTSLHTVRTRRRRLRDHSIISQETQDLAVLTSTSGMESQNASHTDNDEDNKHDVEDDLKLCDDRVTLESVDILNMETEETIQKKPKKTPRPIPNLIPLHLQNTNGSKNNGGSIPLNLTITNVDMILNNSKTMEQSSDMERINRAEISDASQSSSINFHMRNDDSLSQLPKIVKTIGKKKNSSIFDKLYKEKIIAVENNNYTCKECGQVFRCFSEFTIHEKSCTNTDNKLNQLSVPLSGLGSTRCQHCRHRCKSSSDLIIHLKTCLSNTKPLDVVEDSLKNDDETEVPIRSLTDDVSVDDSQAPHPMENVVFVWNPMINNNISMNSIESFDGNVDNSKVLTSTPNHVTLQESETTAAGKKVFKCPHCLFFATTASRFHVHIVGHLNKKPFECSLCSYKSNWRWDITKHIRLKSVRDPEHAKAKVLMTDETGRRNYSKYNKYLTFMHISDLNLEANSASLHLFNRKYRENTTNATNDNASNTLSENNTVDILQSGDSQSTLNKVNMIDEKTDRKSKKTTWKCKKCDYRNASKDALLVHVRKHSKSSTIQPHYEDTAEGVYALDVVGTSDVSSLSYRCGHCNQVSNWKHVIQRHCRLKHNGDVKVVMSSKSILSKISTNGMNNNFNLIKCSKCPFTTTSKTHYENHLKRHSITSESTFKCFICPYYVKTEAELMQHLPLHGISDPEKYGTQVSKPEITSIKRYKCSDCPYESNSKSQFVYHERFHKVNDAPFKCDICNYQVSKRHLLHQHMKVHGIKTQKDVEIIIEPKLLVPLEHTTFNMSKNSKHKEDPLQMWVSCNGEFKKMYKCRTCPFVNTTKHNVLDHEMMHNINDEIYSSLTNLDIQRCNECNFVCKDSDTYLSHIKVHKEEYTRVFYPVNHSKSDIEQIEELKEIVSELNLYKYAKTNDTQQNDENPSNGELMNDFDKKLSSECKQMNKFIYFCSDCPARFLFEKELQIHYKFHCIRLPYQCSICSYTARQRGHLLAHKNVHYKEYQEKTKALQSIRSTYPEHPQPKTVAVGTFVDEPEPVWIVVVDSVKKSNKNETGNERNLVSENTSIPKSYTKQYMCTQCPAKFFKSAALNYHLTLHGGQGSFKCRQCNYAVKTIGNLAKHVAVHGSINGRSDYESNEEINYKNIPLSGTDLYQHKTKVEKRALSEKLIAKPSDHFPPVLQADPQFGLLMHGNPDFIYPTYLKNGRPKEKRYKCHKCPSAFEKREQYKVHLSLHGSKQRYRCELCDYSVKYYANYVQHMRKHQMNADAQAARSGIDKNDPTEEFILQNKSDTKFAIKSLPKQSYKDGSKLSISDQQTLKLLHRRRSSVNSNKDIPDERKIYRCTYCPYTNQRRDALDNHMRRHASVSGISGNFTCYYCDYAAPQSQFLRDHMKVHFHHPKHVTPDHFTNFEGFTLTISRFCDGDLVNNTECVNFDNIGGDTSNISIENKIYVVPNTGEKVA